MESPDRSVLIVGAGVFGLSAALELDARGWRVHVLDPGPVPHPDASSTDLSKVVRMDYGADEFHTRLAAEALDGWDRWNAEADRPFFHQVGFLLLTPGRMDPAGFEGSGFALLRRMGHRLDRIDAESLARRFPAWRGAPYRDGYFNPRAGWVESARVVEWLAGRAAAAGVRIETGCRATDLVESGSGVRGVRLADGSTREADLTLVAAGAWTPTLVPELSGVMWASGQPVLHFRPERPEPFLGERFPVWAADISHSGWYGFPVNDDGIVKIGNHGPGRRIDPAAPREVAAADESACREFLRGVLPELAAAPVVGRRLCLYCDTFDGNFWIGRAPDRPGLAVAAGGSGHGFKFAPVLGRVVADAVEGRGDEVSSRLAWRPLGERAVEQARRVDRGGAV